MEELNMYLVIAVAGLAAIALVSTTALRGWREWLSFKQLELQKDGPEHDRIPSANSRIEIADLKERIKKLEAIASGVDY